MGSCALLVLYLDESERRLFKKRFTFLKFFFLASDSFRSRPIILQAACQLCVLNDSKGLECEVRNAGVALSCNGLRTWPNPLESLEQGA